MKKSLIALAVLAAAGAASAQSSVTLFGIVDATVAFGKGDGGDKFSLTNSGYNSSRLGFRGTEDLGGGMSASFWLEAGIANDDGQGAATNSNNQLSGQGTAVAGRQGLTFNRRSTVSLAGGWGELRLGRDYTPAFWNLTVFDPFGTNGVGQTVTQVGTLIGATARNAIPTDQIGVRASNSIGYFLPSNLGGFYGQAMYYMGENGEAAGATEDDGTGAAVRFGWASGPFNLAAAYSKTTYTATVANPGAGDVETANFGGSWNFGFATIMGHYNQVQISNASLGDPEAKGFVVGGLIPIGAGEIRLSYSTLELEGSFGTPKVEQAAIGYVHNLSKRTAVYTTYAFRKNKDGASTALNGATGAVNQDSQGFDLGIRHSF